MSKDDLELPIRRAAFGGPMVERLETRKERSSNPRIEAVELRASFNSVKDGLFVGIKSLGALLKPVPKR